MQCIKIYIYSIQHELTCVQINDSQGLLSTKYKGWKLGMRMTWVVTVPMDVFSINEKEAKQTLQNYF